MLAFVAALALAQSPAVPSLEAEERLVAWSLADLQAHLPAPPREFRRVHPASLDHPEGVTRPLICGEVRVGSSEGPGEWIAFATLETISGYEQWLGGTAATWCNPDTRRDLGRDWSARFTARLVRDE